MARHKQHSDGLTTRQARFWIGFLDPTNITRIYGNYVSYFVWFQSRGGIVKNLYGRNATGYAFYVQNVTNDNCYIIDADVDTWTINWYGSSNVKLYRQYTIDLKIIDEEGNPIENATVILKDKDDNVVFSVTTNTEGKISTQIVSRGYSEVGAADLDENLTVDYSPHTLIIQKKVSIREKLWQVSV